jgi:phosphate transport system substrate-binding protein
MNRMLTRVALIVVVLNLFATHGFAQKKEQLEGNITISGAFALYPMAVKWAEEFKKIHPKVKIDLSAGGAGKGMTDAVSKMVDIGMVSRDIYAEETRKGAYGIAVTKDAVVVTMSASHPQLADVLSHGLKKDAANNIFITGKYKTWGQAFGIKSGVPIRVVSVSRPRPPRRTGRRGREGRLVLELELGKLLKLAPSEPGACDDQRCIRNEPSQGGTRARQDEGIERCD